MGVIVFSDLDGTLLDHKTYEWSDANDALTLIKRHGIPLVFTTSKTQSEAAQLQAEMGIVGPFIVENGGALFWPEGYQGASAFKRVLGVERASILSFLENCRSAGAEFEGFNDMGADGIMQATGLSRTEAEMANERASSEPLIWRGSEAEKIRFTEQAERAGFRTLQGGRFLTIGGETDKGKAASAVIEEYEKRGVLFNSILCLGDSGNDAALLARATHPVWVRKSGRTPNLPFMVNARCTVKYGPAGWNDAVLSLFKELGAYDQKVVG